MVVGYSDRGGGLNSQKFAGKYEAKLGISGGGVCSFVRSFFFLSFSQPSFIPIHSSFSHSFS